jgi:U3 small nucleolar RNA-associated protein 7
LLHILIIIFTTSNAFRFLVADEGELTTQFSQQQIAASVDIGSATKHFDLHLAEFGPYR